MSDEPTGTSEELIDLAHQLFDLARSGATEGLAAYLEAPDTVAMLIDSGADLEAENSRGQRALSGAVFKKDIASARHLIEAGADPDAGVPTARQTATMFGVTEVEALLAAQ